MRILIALIAAVWALPAAACGPETDCQLGDRTYRIQLPELVTEDTGALIFAHGYRGSSKGTMRNKALRALADELGVALIAADAGVEDDWQIPNVPRNKENDGSREFAYYDALIDDLATRHGLNSDRLVMSGFSAGGMMVWQLACHRGDSFVAFIPIAGTFWDPVPATCSTRVGNLIHIHGTGDKIVPLDGRVIADTRQGRVGAALDMARAKSGFADGVESDGMGLECMSERNADGEILSFCTHPGGHSIKMDYLRHAWTLLSDAGAL
ncbi:MAG: PHB depolymerase family esterase [Pseudomonadota bacterium]